MQYKNGSQVKTKPELVRGLTTVQLVHKTHTHQKRGKVLTDIAGVVETIEHFIYSEGSQVISKQHRNTSMTNEVFFFKSLCQLETFVEHMYTWTMVHMVIVQLFKTSNRFPSNGRARACIRAQASVVTHLSKALYSGRETLRYCTHWSSEGQEGTTLDLVKRSKVANLRTDTCLTPGLSTCF